MEDSLEQLSVIPFLIALPHLKRYPFLAWFLSYCFCAQKKHTKISGTDRELMGKENQTVLTVCTLS